MAATAGDIREVRVNYVGPKGVAQNNFGFLAKINVAGADQADLATAFNTALVKNTSGGLAYGMANDWSINLVDVDDVVPGTAARYSVAPTPVLGSSAQADLPPQCAVLLTFSTALKGRSYRGRFYLPGPVQTDETDGLLSSTAITAYTTIATQLLAIFGPSGSNANWQLAVVSRWHNKAKRTIPVATPVTSIALNPYIATQRGRRP